MSINKEKWVVCDETGLVLNDGVTLYPGYVEVKDGVAYRYESDDPMNEIAKAKPWVLHNKVKHKRVAYKEPCKSKFLQGKHFMSMKALRKHLTKHN